MRFLQRGRMICGRRFLTATSALALIPLLASPAAAQDQAGTPGGTAASTDADIVVTATRMGATRLQETPISITAFSGEDLQERGIDDVRDLAGFTPGLSISSANNGAQIFIRGVGSDNVFVGSDPSTTIHVDGVYLARPSMLFADFLDVERIEVLRGPQGTLYGRNSAGGTINIISRLPTAETEAELLLEYGSFNRVRAAGHAAGALFGEHVLGSIAFLSNDRDGYVRNISPDTRFRRLNSENTVGARGLLRFLISDNAQLILGADYTHQDDTRGQDKPTLLRPDGTPVTGAQVIPDPFTLNTPLTPINRLESWGTSARLEVDLSDTIQLTSITAFRGVDTEFQVDNDFVEVNALSGLIAENQNQFSQELQLTGHSGPLNWIVGLYHFREDHQFDASINVAFVAQQLGVDEFLSLNDTRLESRSYAAFAQGSYALTDRLTVTAGARYSRESKDVVGVGTLRIDGVTNPDYSQNQEDSWSSFTPRLVVDYRLSPDAMVYGSVSRGFKSGGFNFTSRAPAFNPENLWAYEVGVKLDWLNRRLRTNLSLFYYDYSDLQVIAHLEATAENPTAQNVTTNAAQATSMGFELEVAARPVDGLEIGGNLAFLDAEYDEYLAGSPPNFIDVSGNRLTNSPRWTYGLSGQYALPLGNGSRLTARVDFSWRSRVFFTAFNSPVSAQDSYGLLNARIAWTSPNGNWEVAGYVRNLTDEVYTNAITEFSPFGVTKRINEPRTFGIQVNWRMR